MNNGAGAMRLACISILVLVVLGGGCISQTEPPEIKESAYMEGETRVYEGVNLTPISQQGNFMITGTQYIEGDEYMLRVEGLVDRPMNFTYEQLLDYPATSKVVRLDSVDGWSFVAKWTGVPLRTLFEEVDIDEDASTVIFYGADGYSTSLDVDYILENDVILAYRLNDIILPPERGFPVQVVAEGKYGYKWAKWVVRIEITDEPYRGYWESRGYNNRADVGGPEYEDLGIVGGLDDLLTVIPVQYNSSALS